MVSGNVCPVCGYPDLAEPVAPHNDGSTYEYCSSCGFQFGVTDDDRGETYSSWRAKWIAGGMQWWAEKYEPPPAGWDPRAQLATIEPSN